MAINPNNDTRIVMTLDAGGTNLIFSAIQSNTEIVTPKSKPTSQGNLQDTLDTIIAGFEELRAELPGKPAAISFAFPGPADYSRGIIGNLPNFEAFTGGVALGPMLEDHFGIPVFINNDGNLFAYGEALAGVLPRLNQRLREAGSLRQYHSLIGFTLGTGFGAGIVFDNQMLVGNNSSGAEIHNTLNPWNAAWNAEESVSTRAIQRVYAEKTGSKINTGLMPKDIYAIAKGKAEGNPDAARQAFEALGKSLGSSIANAMSLIDAIAVVGGGITAAWDLFAPAMFAEINRDYTNDKGNRFPRLSYKVYNLEDETEFRTFAKGRTRTATVPNSGRTISYDDLPRNGIALSTLGASRAIALGACAFALKQLNG